MAGPTATTRLEFVNGAFPAESCDVPVITLGSLMAKMPARLAFPGVTRSGSEYTNLDIDMIPVEALQGELPSVQYSVRVEAFDPAGTLLGSGDFSGCPPGGYFCATLIVHDVLGALGVTSLDSGQLRVTKRTGDGALWGFASLVSNDGRIAAISGLVP